ncbi:unnamed protein product, partial [Closterium sp. NIES-53]
GEVPDVLIPWIRATRLQLERRFHTDLPVLRLHSDRGGEFSSGLLRAFCQGEGTERTFTLPASPQQNGVAERRIGLVMEPRVSVPETSPTLRWTGEVGDASVFRVWGSRAFVRNTSVDKLSSRAVPCVFLGFVPDAPGWQFYHPTSRRVFPSQDVTFDESVPFYHPVKPVEVAVESGPVRGTEPGGTETGGAEPGGAEPGGAETRGAEPGGAEPGGAVPGGAEPGGHEPEGTAPGGALSSQQLHEWYSQHCRHRCGAVGAGGATGAGAEGAGATGAGVAADPGVGTRGASATGPGGARTDGTGGAGTGDAARAAGGAGGADARPTGGAGADGAAGAGAPGGTGVGTAGAAGGAAGVGAAAGGAGAVSAGSGGAARPQPLRPRCLLLLLTLVRLEVLLSVVSLSLVLRCLFPAHTGRRVPRQRPPAVPGTHRMALRPSTTPLRVPLPSPPESSLPALADPESDSLRAASPTVTRLLATVVTDPSFESTVASALVAELVDFAAHCRLDYAASLVAESESVCPPSVGGECALGTDVLEDRQEDFECFAAAGPYSSQWQSAMDAEMAFWKSTGTYVDEVPPPGANIVSAMWIFRVKRPPGSPPVFKARYVARGFSQRQGVDIFQTFSPTPKMTTLRVLLHVAAQHDYELHSLDFSTAFLQGSLHEEIWLRRPPGFTGSFPPGTQWSLRRPVYGLRQAPREWHDTLRTTLAALRFAPSTADPSLFLRTNTSLPPFYILVYVDDLVFATSDTEGLAHVKSGLQKRHTCTDL